MWDVPTDLAKGDQCQISLVNVLDDTDDVARSKSIRKVLSRRGMSLRTARGDVSTRKVLSRCGMSDDGER